MAKKGESYAQVRVDLGKWAQDYMRINNLNQVDLANRLYDEGGKPVNRSRVCDMVKGRQNTMKFLGIVVDSIYGGDYTAMGRYAIDEDGEETLAILAFKKSLDKAGKGTTSRIVKAFMNAMANKKTDQIKAAIKLLEE